MRRRSERGVLFMSRVTVGVSGGGVNAIRLVSMIVDVWCLMRFGLFLQPLHHPTADPTMALESDLDLVVLLDELGFSEAWIGEHHSSGWENIGAPEAFIAAAAERTHQIQLGTGVIQLGLHHPLVALDRMIFLDHLTKGRTSFGMGVGGGIPSDLSVFGLDPESAGRRLNESIEAMLALLDGSAPVSMKTDWFEMNEAVLQVRPFTDPHMPLAMASAHPDNAALMGRHGGSVLLGGPPASVPGVWENLRRGASEVGREASRDQIMMSTVLHLAETTEKARDGFRDGAIAEFYEFQVGWNRRPEPEGTPQDWYESYVAKHIIGSAADAIEALEWMSEESGGVGGVIFMTRDWAGVEAQRETWRLFADEVAPHFSG